MKKAHGFKNKVVLSVVPFTLGLGLITVSSLVNNNVNADTNIPTETSTSLSNNNQATTNEEPQSGLSDSVTTIASKYISIDPSTKRFIVSDKINSALDANEVEQVKSMVNQTNSKLSSVPKNTNAVLETQNGQETSLNNIRKNPYIISARSGVTTVKFYWNYARVYLSARDARFGIASGIGVAGLYIPHPAVKAACVIAGAGTSYITNGIWFDFNYYTGMVSKAGLQ